MLLLNKDELFTDVYDHLRHVNLSSRLFQLQEFIRRPENTVVVNIDSQYVYRPELVSLNYYGIEELYPFILIVNNLKTLMEFDPKLFNNQMLMVKSDVVKKILEDIGD